MRTGPADGGATGPVYLMPPEDFLPFMVPFKGGPGPLCGGACSETFQWSVDSDSYASLITVAPCSRSRRCIFWGWHMFLFLLCGNLFAGNPRARAPLPILMFLHCRLHISRPCRARFRVSPASVQQSRLPSWTHPASRRFSLSSRPTSRIGSSHQTTSARCSFPFLLMFMLLEVKYLKQQHISDGCRCTTWHVWRGSLHALIQGTSRVIATETAPGGAPASVTASPVEEAPAMVARTLACHH